MTNRDVVNGTGGHAAAEIPNRALAVAASAVIGIGCAGNRALRDHVAQHARLDPRPGLAMSIEPAMKGFPLLNPLDCGEALLAPCREFECIFTAVAFVGCVGVFAVVDVVALPIELPIRHGQWSDLEAIGASCLLEDPVRRVTDRIAARMAADVGFSLDPAKADAEAGAVVLKVKTEKFARSGRIRWAGKATLEEPDGKILWFGDCEVETPERNVESIRINCPAARQEVEALADGCAAAVVRDLQRVLRTSEPAPVPGAASDTTPPTE